MAGDSSPAAPHSMVLPASRSRTVFRACVVNAVKDGETVMEQLISVTRNALGSDEATVRNIQQRNLVSDALRLLQQHEASLVKAYPMALLEIFAEGPSNARARSAADTGMDFGELSLMDESEVLAQVELSRAQQIALHTTDATLAELNTLVSSAQGLRNVQPERNPLRPENYIRALQQVVGDTAVSSDVRQLWMQHMRESLGRQLVAAYQKAAQSLRENGVEPVGYAVAGMPAAGRSSVAGGGYVASQMGYPSTYGGPATDYGHSGAYSRSMGHPPSTWNGGAMASTGMPLAPEAEEALLTVGILRQMLAGHGDPFHFDAAQGGYAAALPTEPQALGTTPSAETYYPAVAAEAMEDIAQLERLVGRLAGGASAPRSDWGNASGAAMAGSVPSMPAAVAASRSATEVVSRMMENIAQDTRLLPPVQRVVQNLEPAIKQLVRHDSRFFSDDKHPARRLLDELTQRSLAFANEDSPGFSRFLRLLNEAVTHLAATDIRSAEPFDNVLDALQKAWQAQDQQLRERRDAEEQALLQSERQQMLADKIAADIRKMPDANQVPADLLEFVTGPWSRVVAQAQTGQSDGADGDPGGYLAMVPLLFWCAQPELLRAEPDRLGKAIAGMLGTVREGLRSIAHPEDQIDLVLERLVALHQTARDYADAVAQAAAPSAPEPVLGTDRADAVDDDASAQAPLAAAEPLVQKGQWIELISNRKPVRTQLTWTSPNGTLFLFTAADGSTQSMTRRMVAKLLAEGLLTVGVAAPAVERPKAAAATGGDPATARNRAAKPAKRR